MKTLEELIENGKAWVDKNGESRLIIIKCKHEDTEALPDDSGIICNTCFASAETWQKLMRLNLND